jgi:hypothetical protein
LASIVHVPTATKLTVEPAREHTDGVPDVRDTDKPDEAVAATAYVWPATTA